MVDTLLGGQAEQEQLVAKHSRKAEVDHADGRPGHAVKYLLRERDIHTRVHI